MSAREVVMVDAVCTAFGYPEIGILFGRYAQHKINKPPALESNISLQVSKTTCNPG
jgi:hypothetical protein